MAAAFPLGPPLPPFHWPGQPIAGWIALAPLLASSIRAARPAEALGLGAATGGIAFTFILAWIPPFLTRWARLSAIEAAGAFLILLIYLALWPALFAWIAHRLARRGGASLACLAAPAVWVGLELARARALTGFPWSLLGYSQERFLAASQPADLGGVYAVSFTLACFSASLALLLLEAGDRGRKGRVAILILAALGAAGPIYGAIRMRSLGREDRTLPVALVQANVAQEEKWDPSSTRRIETDHVAMTYDAAGWGARLIVWSESSVPISTTRDAAYGRRLSDLAREIGTDLAIGTVTYGRDRTGREAPFNSALLLSPSGEVVSQYDKRQLVPFGEYVPLKPYLFFVRQLVAEASDFGSGEGSGLMRGSDAALAALICYEAIFPELPREALLEGAEALVNLTNDAWYGDTGMPRQHLAMSRLRSIETRRWLMRSASTGISALVDPAGRIAQRTRLGERALVTGTIGLRRDLTIYTRCGDAFAWGCAIVAALALVWPPFHRRDS